MRAPNISNDTEYDFYINSFVSSVVNPVKKLIKLTVLNWSPSNWLKWSSTSNLKWETWNLGYILKSEAWFATESVSETAKALSTTITSIVATTVGLAVLASFLNTSSASSIWMTINQLQIFLQNI